jgi:hypothetical protein
MQPIVRGVVLASALALTGCSHPDAAMGRWYGRLVGGEAPTVVSRKDATGNRSRQKVVEVSFDRPITAAYTLDTGDTLQIFVDGQQSDPAMAERQAAQLKGRVRERFTVETMTDQILEFYGNATAALAA